MPAQSSAENLDFVRRIVAGWLAGATERAELAHSGWLRSVAPGLAVVQDDAMTKDGRDATKPYRVRAGGVWYWVDPTVPAGEIEPGDTIVVYPASGAATVAMLCSPWRPGDAPVVLAAEGETFEVPAHDIAALHLAAIDEEQG